MKDKMKDFVKKITSSGSGTPSSFKGTSHVLGSGPSPSSSSSHPASRPSNPSANPRPAPMRPSPPPPPTSTTDFAPLTPLVSSSSCRPDANGTAAAAVACPSCGDAFPSEVAVSEHLDGCLASAGGARACASAYLAADPPPPAASVEVVKRLLGNLLREPENDKFRRVRLSNPRIKEAVADREGGMELLEAVGFRVRDEGGEPFAVMNEVPRDARLNGIRRAVLLLEGAHPSAPPVKAEVEAKESCSNVADLQDGAKNIDRQVRVFFSVPESSVAQNDVPDSFYNLTGNEIRNEAKMRRERLEQSRLLIPKSYKEKQALAARQKYKQAVIRVEFPDRMILQGVFLPGEATGSLYEFVTSALKQPGLEFELISPAIPKPRVVPHFPNPGERARTLQEEELVPSALLKFIPRETDSVVFTGLLDELLKASEPLPAASQ
ncbi:Plant UBX domain-containing protein 2 [Zea mays]|uniref:Plant UBX domain-containing protein 2 n=2 Tax=Zea mays TaxID=4577 RepID=A0A1D6EPM5_MAIZE|nr:plant UBX domain-containing protein 2 [Zea mays]ONM21722.1 Plant UBX domain-containing protein 2 [Zea mays]PWZ39282.1 Plant UBX domain-containing protein 2 [Zea mays]|eukprot:XP_008670173.1 plant UBX domain-containing protein 2 [Zea mays]